VFRPRFEPRTPPPEYKYRALLEDPSVQLYDIYIYIYIYILSPLCVSIDGVWIGEWIYWPLYTHDSELQVITPPPLISTIHKSPHHPLSLFQPAVSSPAVPWQWLQTVGILPLHALKSSLQRSPYRADLVAPVFFKVIPRHGPHRNTSFPTVSLLLRVDSLLREPVYRAVA
jgi:hypothetical protein